MQVIKKQENHDLPTILRLLAITLIVANHFDVLKYGGGGSELLMLMVGYNIATFKIKSVFDADSPKAIGGMIVKVLIPTIGYLLILQWYYDSFMISSLLLFSNFYNENHPMGFSYWFIEVYVQILIIIYLLISFKKVRSFLIVNPQLSSFIFVVSSFLIYLVVNHFWNTDDLYRRVPHAMLWMFSFGYAARVTKDKPAKFLLSLLFILMSYIYFSSAISLFVLCSLLLIWNIKVTIPRLIKKYVYAVSLSSLFIYLTHFQVKSVVEKYFPNQPELYLISALIIGAFINIIYSRSYKFIVSNIKIYNRT